MAYLLMGVGGWYGIFFVFCLLPSIILGVIFQYLISHQATRKYTVYLLTAIGTIASILVNYWVLNIPIKDQFYFPVIITITLTTFIVSWIRSYFLNRRKCYINNLIEEIKTIGFAIFFTPLVMVVIFFSVLFSVDWIAKNVF